LHRCTVADRLHYGSKFFTQIVNAAEQVIIGRLYANAQKQPRRAVIVIALVDVYRLASWHNNQRDLIAVNLDCVNHSGSQHEVSLPAEVGFYDCSQCVAKVL
jgi:hypothetical protein